MTKEEILKRAQDSRYNQLDEMEIDIIQKGNQIGMIVGLIFCLIIMGIKMHFDLPYQDVYSIYCSILSGQYMYRWFRQKEKYLLFCGMIWGCTAIVLFIVYLTKII